MKTLIIMSAIPASGKSTWAAKYQATHPNTYIVSSDAIRMELNGGDYTNYTKQDLVWKTFSERIHEYGKIKGATVILDAINDLNILRKKYVEENPEFDRRVLVLLPFDKEKSIDYNSLRPEGMKVPDDVMPILINKFEQPTEEILALFDEVIRVEW